MRRNTVRTKIIADFQEQQKLLRKQEGELYRCRFCRIPILAVLGKDGFYAVKGTGGGAEIRMEKALVYIPYRQIEKIVYGEFFLEVTYRQTEEAADGERVDTCTMVCPLWRIVSKDLARKLSRKTNGAVLAEGRKAEDMFLPLLLAIGYVILYASYIRDFTERVLMKGW